MYELLCHVILYHPDTAIDAVNVTPSRYGDDIELGLWLVLGRGKLTTVAVDKCLKC